MTSQRSLASMFAAVRAQRVLVGVIVGLGIILGLGAVRFVPAKYHAVATVLMVAEPPDSQNRLVPSSATKPLLSADLPSLATSASVLTRFSSDIGATGPLDKLRSRIHARATLDSNILPVEFTAGSASDAMRGANALADEIVRGYRDLATRRFDSLIRDLQGQMAARRAQLQRLDQQLETAARSYPYIDVNSAGGTSDTSSVYGHLIALRTERDELRATMRGDAAAATETMRLVRDAEPPALRDIVENDSVYRSLRDQYAKDLASLEHLEAFGSERYPGVIEMRDVVSREAAGVAAARIRAAKAGPSANASYAQALDAEARASVQLAGDRAKLAALDEELDGVDGAATRSGVATDVALVRRDRQNLEVAYATLADRLAKTVADRAEAASTGSVVVMDHARFAERAIWTGGVVIAAGAVVFSVWLALTLAIALDGSRQGFGSPTVVESVYGAPVLGSVI